MSTSTAAAAPHRPAPGPGPSPVTCIPPASADPDLIDQFRTRVRQLFVLFDAALRDPAPATIADLRDGLHRLAGSAAFFGYPRLGIAAGDFGERLRQSDAADPPFLNAIHAALYRLSSEQA